MIFRHYEKGDCSALLDLMRQGVEEVGTKLDEEKAKSHFHSCENGSCLCLVVLDEKDIVGTGGIKIVEPGLAEIDNLYLSKKFRGEGKAKFLLDMLINFGKNHDCKRIVVFLSPQMDEALKFFKRNDFAEPIDKRKFDRYSHEDRKVPFVFDS